MQEFLDTLKGFKKSYTYIEEAVQLYWKPLHFFHRFFKKSNKEKFSQAAFYLISGLLLLYIFWEAEKTMAYLSKIIVIDIGLVIPMFILLTLSHRITSKILKVKSAGKPIDTFYYILFVKIFLAPFLISFLLIFYKLEDYRFYFLYNCTFLISLILHLFYSSRVFFKHLKAVFLSIVFNMLLFNAFAFLFGLVTVDYEEALSANLETDKISQEFMEVAERTNLIRQSPPLYKLLVVHKSSIYTNYIFYADADSVSYLDNHIYSQEQLFESLNLVKQLKQSQQLLDTAINSLSFKRNAALYRKWRHYQSQLISNFEGRLDFEKEPIKETLMVHLLQLNNQLVTANMHVLHADTNLFNDYRATLEEEIVLFRASRISEYPKDIALWIAFPSILMADFFWPITDE